MYLLYPLALCLHYLIFAILLKVLVDKYELKTILVNTYLISLLILLFLYPKEIITKPDINYIYIILLSFTLMFGMCVWGNGFQLNLNMGKIDGLAIAFYLPIFTLISIYFYKQKIKIQNLIGITIIGIGAYLTLL